MSDTCGFHVAPGFLCVLDSVHSGRDLREPHFHPDVPVGATCGYRDTCVMPPGHRSPHTDTPPDPARRHDLDRLLLVQAHALWSAALWSHQTGPGKRLYQRMSNPQPGDVVVETSTLGRSIMLTPSRAAVGVLLRRERMPIMGPERWAYGEPSDWGQPCYAEERYPGCVGGHPDGSWQHEPYSECPKEEAFLVQPLDDGPPFRWVNASMIAIPDDTVREWVGE